MLLKRNILELALADALYFSTLRVKLIAGETYIIFNISTSLSYYVFKIVRDSPPFPRRLLFFIWRRFYKHSVLVCGDKFIGWMFPGGGMCCLCWRWRPALIDSERDLSDMILCACRHPVFLMPRFPFQQGFL